MERTVKALCNKKQVNETFHKISLYIKKNHSVALNERDRKQYIKQLYESIRQHGETNTTKHVDEYVTKTFIKNLIMNLPNQNKHTSSKPSKPQTNSKNVGIRQINVTNQVPSSRDHFSTDPRDAVYNTKAEYGKTTMNKFDKLMMEREVVTPKKPNIPDFLKSTNTNSSSDTTDLPMLPNLGGTSSSMSTLDMAFGDPIPKSDKSFDIDPKAKLKSIQMERNSLTNIPSDSSGPPMAIETKEKDTTPSIPPTPPMDTRSSIQPPSAITIKPRFIEPVFRDTVGIQFTLDDINEIMERIFSVTEVLSTKKEKENELILKENKLNDEIEKHQEIINSRYVDVESKIEVVKTSIETTIETTIQEVGGILDSLHKMYTDAQIETVDKLKIKIEELISKLEGSVKTINDVVSDNVDLISKINEMSLQINEMSSQINKMGLTTKSPITVPISTPNYILSLNSQNKVWTGLISAKTSPDVYDGTIDDLSPNPKYRYNIPALMFQGVFAYGIDFIRTEDDIDQIKLSLPQLQVEIDIPIINLQSVGCIVNSIISSVTINSSNVEVICSNRIVSCGIKLWCKKIRS